ncbi:hypothetical protein AVEN_162843-1 [Araneus ventricosus]|uniref:Granulins domain-containing protein n=1 Tax=Araneus ventricosus TaxID=182803 RepID=A0A4Y2C5U9_ARAVE|nr:hypothetical protein AVEN_162843-1 [Araneus ventricosus]
MVYIAVRNILHCDQLPIRNKVQKIHLFVRSAEKIPPTVENVKELRHMPRGSTNVQIAILLVNYLIRYSCCPLVRACCIDGLHCCPEHMHCDATSRYCNQGPRNITSLRQIPAEKNPPTVENVKESCHMPRWQYQSRSQYLCKLPNTRLSCCPLVRAACIDGLIAVRTYAL